MVLNVEPLCFKNELRWMKKKDAWWNDAMKMCLIKMRQLFKKMMQLSRAALRNISKESYREYMVGVVVDRRARRARI